MQIINKALVFLVVICSNAFAINMKQSEVQKLPATALTVFIPKVTTDKQVIGYFHQLLPTTTINNIYTTPYPDTYAVIMGSNIVYGNLHSSYLMAGHLFNVYTKDDITTKLQQQTAPKIDITTINVSDAIVVKSSNKVNKKLIVFIDPDCPYCRQLEQQLVSQGISQKADIYYMLMPLAIHPNAKIHTTNILCSSFPYKTLQEYMLKNNEHPSIKLTQDCNIEPVLERIGSIARSLNINGAPAIVTGEGILVMGADIQAIDEYVNRKEISDVR